MTPKKLSRRRRKRVPADVIGGTKQYRWGKGANKKAQRLAGEVRVGRLEDLPPDHPARQP